MNGQDLRKLYESDGPQEFCGKMLALLREEKDKRKVKPEDFSLRELWEAVGRPAFGKMRQDLALLDERVLREDALNTQAYSVITGELIAQKVIEGYDAVEAIGDQLVTVMPSKRRNENIPGFNALDMPVEVSESEDYPELDGLGEKYVTSQATKKGMIISVTEELVMEDQTGLLLQRAGMVGERIRLDREKTILTGVQDVNSTVYKPSGSASALYSSGHSNLVASNALADWTDLDKAYAAFRNLKDEVSEHVLQRWSQFKLLVPVSLGGTAHRIVSATEVRATVGSNESVTTENRFRGLNPPLSSPYLDDQSTSTWYVGDFKRQFVWHEVWPLQTFRQREDSESRFVRDVVARFKARYLGGIAAIDYKYVVKNISGAS